MKQKISISIEEEVLKKVDEILKNFQFRNKSHFIEIAIRKLIEEKKNDN